jgi:hypothetical protein
MTIMTLTTRLIAGSSHSKPVHRMTAPAITVTPSHFSTDPAAAEPAKRRGRISCQKSPAYRGFGYGGEQQYDLATQDARVRSATICFPLVSGLHSKAAMKLARPTQVPMSIGMANPHCNVVAA